MKNATVLCPMNAEFAGINPHSDAPIGRTWIAVAKRLLRFFASQKGWTVFIFLPPRAPFFSSRVFHPCFSHASLSQTPFQHGVQAAEAESLPADLHPRAGHPDAVLDRGRVRGDRGGAGGGFGGPGGDERAVRQVLHDGELVHGGAERAQEDAEAG